MSELFWSNEFFKLEFDNKNMYNSEWYNSLISPTLAPPNWVFAPVWTILYITIFLALLFYIIKKSENKLEGYTYFTIQLFLNLIWSPAFFVLQNIQAAMIIILLLDLFVILTIRRFYLVSKTAGILLIPYLAWIIFATYLNAGYLILN